MAFVGAVAPRAGDRGVSRSMSGDGAGGVAGGVAGVTGFTGSGCGGGVTAAGVEAVSRTDGAVSRADGSAASRDDGHASHPMIAIARLIAITLTAPHEMTRDGGSAGGTRTDEGAMGAVSGGARWGS